MAKVVLDLTSDEYYLHFPPSHYEWLCARFPRDEFVYVGDREQLARNIVDADVLWCWHVTNPILEIAGQLQWVMFASDDVEPLLVPALKQLGVIVTNSGGVRAQAVAEHALGMILACTRRFADRHLLQTKRLYTPHHFVRTNPLPTEIAGRTALIIGYGSIGSQLGLVLKNGFGMTIHAVRRHPTLPSEGADKVFDVTDLLEVLPHADIVIAALPATNETRHLLRNKHFVAMKESAYLINIGHGSTVNTDALIAALRHQRIAGAALDSLERPPEPESPLWDFEETLQISPHYAGVTPNLWTHMAQLFATNFDLFTNREPLLNQVDLDLGY